MTAIAYLDFDLLVQREGNEYRARVVHSPAGQAAATFAVPFSDLELENFLLRVGRARLGVRRIDSPEVNAAKSCGERLFSAVFQGEVLGCLRSSLDEAARRGEGLRIRLRLTDVPELADLPWEYLYNPALNRFLALSVTTPFVRYLDLPERIRPLTVRTPLRALVMISSPTDYPQLDVEREWSKLREALGDLEQRGLLALERLDDATLASLQKRLRRGEYHIFHFIGHGGFNQQAQDGLLILEDEHGRGRPVSGQDLGMLLHDHRPMRLAILNACEGARASRTDPFAGTAQSLVQQGIPAVIAMQFEITDEAAITFAHEFYGAVADGYPADAALAEARKAIFAQGNGLEWGTPVLYLRCPDGRIFEREDGPKEEVGRAPERSRETPAESRNATPQVSLRSASPTEERFGFIRARWRPAAMGVLLLVILAGGTMWLRKNWDRSETVPPEAPQPAPQVASLTIQADKREIGVDERMALKVKGIYSDGGSDELSEGIEWRSSDPSVATVSSGGRVQARKAGKAEITARYADVVSGPFPLSVKAEERPAPPPPPVRLVSLRVEADKREIKVQERARLKVSGRYSDGNQAELLKNIEWQSSDRSIAAVDSAGRVLGRREGKVEITARVAGVVSPPLALSVEEARERVPLPAVPVERINEHLKRARYYRERGDYTRALSELEKARSLNPVDREIREEIASVKRACNAEKKLGRQGLTC